MHRNLGNCDYGNFVVFLQCGLEMEFFPEMACLSSRLEAILAPLKGNLGNNSDDDNVNEIVTALISDLG